jgi:hypothetical protein
MQAEAALPLLRQRLGESSRQQGSDEGPSSFSDVEEELLVADDGSVIAAGPAPMDTDAPAPSADTTTAAKAAVPAAGDEGHPSGHYGQTGQGWTLSNTSCTS